MENKKRLIDRNEIFPNGTFFASAEDPLKSLDKLIERIWSIPTIDAVEVVRCKDCKRWCALDCDSNYGTCSELTDRYREDCESSFDETTRFDDFCSYGERKDNGHCKN